MKRVLLSLFVLALLGSLWVPDAFGAITCKNISDRSNLTLHPIGDRECRTSSTCPTGWSKISSTCSTATVGGNITYILHHEMVIKCTWLEFQGDWAADPAAVSVSHSVEGEGNYATCSGWPSGTPVNQLPPGTSSAPVLHSDAPFGFGQFFFNVTYGKTGSSSSPGATLTCTDNNPGTTLTYRFFCAEGVSNTGFVTLVPVVGDPPTPQPAPAFTNCSPARVAAGKCTMLLGGIPTKIMKVKGQDVTVVDEAACLAAFGPAAVVNALNSGQTQNLASKELLFYREIASEGQCNTSTPSPTVPGLPSAAYGRHCQSDIGPFTDNEDPTNIFAGDPDVEGFDNELRVCPTGPKKTPPHTAAHDVEQAALTSSVTTNPQPVLNLNCTSGGNTELARYTVLIPDQPPLLSIDIDISPLSDAPTLEGVAPISARIVEGDGVRSLELKYPTCDQGSAPGLSDEVIANNPGLTNNQNVTLHLEGQTKDVGLGPVLFDGAFIIKVNGLQ
jgi:hypothetical protein